jgi:hypothetical protein
MVQFMPWITNLHCHAMRLAREKVTQVETFFKARNHGLPCSCLKYHQRCETKGVIHWFISQDSVVTCHHKSFRYVRKHTSVKGNNVSEIISHHSYDSYLKTVVINMRNKQTAVKQQENSASKGKHLKVVITKTWTHPNSTWKLSFMWIK